MIWRGRTPTIGLEDRIIRVGTLVLVLFLPLTYWPDAATGKQALVLGLGSVVAGALVWRTARGGNSRALRGPGVGWAVFLTIASLSLIGAVKPYQGAKALFFLGLGCCLCLAVAEGWRTDGLPQRLGAAIGLGGALAALLALGAHALSIESEVGIVPFGNTNYAGAYFATVSPLTLGMALGARGSWRWFHGSAFLLMVVALTLTKARGGWVAFLAAMIMMGVCLFVVQGVARKSGMQAMAGAAALTAVAEALLRLTGTSLWRSTATILDPTHPTNQARLTWWGDTLRMIMDAPILGIGLGNFPYVYPRYASLDRLPFMQLNPFLEHPHNEYLGLGAEVGLVGLMAFVGLLAAGAVAATRALRARSQAGAETAGLIGAATAGVVNALFFYIWHSPVGILFWTILGLAWATNQPPFHLHPGRSATRGQSVRLAVAVLGIVGIIALGFNLGVRSLVSTYIADQARANWYALRGTEALDGYRRAVSWEGDNFLIPFEAGMGFFRASLFAQAADAFVEATRLHPTHLAARNNLGLTLVRLGNIPGAKARYQEALEINPEYAVARNNLANILLAEKDLPGAIREYRRAIRSHPDYAEAWHNLAVALAEAGQESDAIRAFRRAAAINSTMTDATRRAEELEMRLGRSRRAGELSP